MKRFLIFAAVLTVVTAVAATAGSSDKAQVNFNLDEYLELSVASGKNVDFGDVSPTDKSIKLQSATTLKVESNTEWQIDVSKAVLQKPADAPADGTIADKLEVKVKPAQGVGDQDDITVDYTLSGLDDLPAGEYALEVTFTASAR